MWISEPTPVTTSSITAVSWSTEVKSPLKYSGVDPGEILLNKGNLAGGKQREFANGFDSAEK